MTEVEDQRNDSATDNNVAQLQESADGMSQMQIRDSQLQQQHTPAGDNGSQDDHEETNSQDFSYNHVSQLSEVTDDVFAEELEGADNLDTDLNDYNRLVQATQKKMKLLSDTDSQKGSKKAASVRSEGEFSDEFIRNFFIKFGMRKTLESFQQEWCELKAQDALNLNDLPQIPQIYEKNAQLSDELAVLQEELDEARIVAEKARSTYDKLKKQRDFQKINHRRVQQEKAKLAGDALKNKRINEDMQSEFDNLSSKYESIVKEKMLMKLEKDRLIAKVDNLELSISQDDQQNQDKLEESKTEKMGLSALDKTSAHSSIQKNNKQGSQATIGALKMTNTQTKIPSRDRMNPYLTENFEPTGSHLSVVKTFKGHLMGVTSVAYNPKKDIIATGSDDTTWKLWSVPNGDLIMSGEGHIDWVGGVDFHPKGNLLASCSGDGTVKIWDFVRASCAHTFAEHGQPVWKVAYHDTGDFLLSCSMDHTVKLWDMNMPKSRFTFRGHVDSVNSVQFLPYSQCFASASGDKTVALWDIRTSQCVQTFYGHNNAVNSCKFNVKGDKIVSADCDGITKIWDVRMVKEEMQFDSGLTSANSAVFDKAGQTVYVASDDATIKVFSLKTGNKEGELKSHEDAVLDLTFDHNREGYFVSAGSDCSFRIWQ